MKKKIFALIILFFLIINILSFFSLSVSGNVSGSDSGSVSGNVSGSDSGSVSGNVSDSVSGSVSGNVSDSVSDSVSGSDSNKGSYFRLDFKKVKEYLSTSFSFNSFSNHSLDSKNKESFNPNTSTTNALDYGINTFDPFRRVFNMLGSAFGFSLYSENPRISVGFLRFLLILVLFILFRTGLNSAFSNLPVRQLNILSLILSLIGIFMMPDSWILLNGGTISIIIMLLLPFLFFLLVVILFLKSFFPNSFSKISFSDNPIILTIITILLAFFLLKLLDLYINLMGVK